MKKLFTKEFIAICKDYAKKSHRVLDETIDDTAKVCKYTIRFYSHAVEFRYVKKESLYFKPSSLYCVIYLNKNSVAYYHLPDLIPHLPEKSFQPCYFWCIESADRLKNCFENLVKTLENVLSQLANFPLEEATLSASLFKSYQAIFGLKDKDLDFSKIEDAKEHTQVFFLSLQNTRDGYLFSRFSNFSPYVCLQKNKVKKAIQKYEKLDQKGKLLEYEKSLLSHLKDPDSRVSIAIDSGCSTSVEVEKQITGLSFLKAFLIVYSFSSIFFCGCFALYRLIISVNALTVLAAPWYMGFLCAGLCSIFGSIAWTSLFPIPNKRISIEKQKEMLKILVSKGLKRLVVICFALSLAASIFFTVMIMIPCIRFYDDRISFYGNNYNYSEIHSVYYISARYNVYGDRIERGSYVILFQDQTSLDLDGSASVDVTVRDVLPILKEKGFEVQFADSENDLPWYNPK